MLTVCLELQVEQAFGRCCHLPGWCRAFHQPRASPLKIQQGKEGGRLPGGLSPCCPSVKSRPLPRSSGMGNRSACACSKAPQQGTPPFIFVRVVPATPESELCPAGIAPFVAPAVAESSCKRRWRSTATCTTRLGHGVDCGTVRGVDTRGVESRGGKHTRAGAHEFSL